MRPDVAAVLLLAAACGGGATGRPAHPLPIAAPDEQVTELIAAALAADARMDPADSLYTTDRTIVADGRPRFNPPWFAGIGPGGEVAVTSSRIELRGGLAWAHVEYRWMSTEIGKASEGRATLVLVPARDRPGAWRIHHAHSSSPDG